MPIAARPFHALQAEAVDVPMSMHPFVRLAFEAIQLFVETRESLTPPESLFLALPEAQRRGSAFVCLKLEGNLRGCIGSIQPAQENLALEIVHNAIAAASRDHRFSPVQRCESDVLEVTVDILGRFEPVDYSQGCSSRPTVPGALDPRRFGVLVQAGERQGILLPDIQGITTAAEQVAIAREKAGIRPDEPIELFRFCVMRYR
jgi:AmmeMemoRadiSam system protein A